MSQSPDLDDADIARAIADAMAHDGVDLDSLDEVNAWLRKRLAAVLSEAVATLDDPPR